MSVGESVESGATCSQCGRPTSGTCSEGGARWALCEECFEAELQALERVCEGEAVTEEEG
jgi:hypothetical protein